MMSACLVLVLSLAAADPAEAARSVETVAREAFAAVPGETAFVFTEITDAGPKPLFGINADKRFAIGSSFKLYILGTLIDEVNAGRRRIDDTMLLRPDLRGPPHSEMADWPAGSPVTLHTLADSV